MIYSKSSDRVRFIQRAPYVLGEDHGGILAQQASLSFTWPAFASLKQMSSTTIHQNYWGLLR